MFIYTGETTNMYNTTAQNIRENIHGLKSLQLIQHTKPSTSTSINTNTTSRQTGHSQAAPKRHAPHTPFTDTRPQKKTLKRTNRTEKPTTLRVTPQKNKYNLRSTNPITKSKPFETDTHRLTSAQHDETFPSNSGDDEVSLPDDIFNENSTAEEDISYMERARAIMSKYKTIEHHHTHPKSKESWLIHTIRSIIC